LPVATDSQDDSHSHEKKEHGGEEPFPYRGHGGEACPEGRPYRIEREDNDDPDILENVEDRPPKSYVRFLADPLGSGECSRGKPPQEKEIEETIRKGENHIRRRGEKTIGGSLSGGIRTQQFVYIGNGVIRPQIEYGTGINSELREYDHEQSKDDEKQQEYGFQIGYTAVTFCMHIESLFQHRIAISTDNR
jgi:hypothetical protein